LKKIVLEKNHVIKLYEVAKIKECGGPIVHPTPIALRITIVIHDVLLFFSIFLFFNFCYDFFFKSIFVDFIF